MRKRGNGLGFFDAKKGRRAAFVGEGVLLLFFAVKKKKGTCFGGGGKKRTKVS